MTKEEIKKYLADVQDLIANNCCDDAIDKLLELCDIVEDFKDVKNNLLVLSGRLNSNEKNFHVKGIIEFDDYNMENNKIKNALLSIITSYDEDKLMETIGRSNGKLIHNTPSKMKLDKYYITSVRIAKDTVDIVKNFAKSENSEIQLLKISPTMSVSLIDITGGSVFDINFIGENKEQRIHEDSFTEWRFSIKPKEKGIHTIQLCANFIEIFNGEKSYKTAYFESIITIISEDTALDTEWKDTVIKIVREEKEMIIPPVKIEDKNSSKYKDAPKIESTSDSSVVLSTSEVAKTGILKKLPYILTAAAAAAIIIFFIRSEGFNNKSNGESSSDHRPVEINKEKTDSLPLNDLKLRLDQDIKPNFVTVNNDTIEYSEQIHDKEWLILLKQEQLFKIIESPSDRVSVMVWGKYGEAMADFKLDLYVDSTYNLKTTLRDSSSVQVITNSRQEIMFNGVFPKRDSFYNNKKDNEFFHYYKLKNGRYKLTIKKQETISCKVLDILIDSDTTIRLDCRTLPRIVNCSIRLPFENPKVYYNNIEYKSKIESKADVRKSKGWIYSQKVKEGNYELKVIDPKGQYQCDRKNIKLTKDVAVAIICRENVIYFNPKLRLENGGKFLNDNTTIILGNKQMEVKGKLEKKDLVFTLSRIEKGEYDLILKIVRKNKTILDCTRKSLSINSSNEYILKNCKETSEESSPNIFSTPKFFDILIRLKDGKKYSKDKLSTIFDGRDKAAEVRYDKNDMIIEFKNISKGYHSVSINAFRKGKNVLNCRNQQIDVGVKKEYTLDGCIGL